MFVILTMNLLELSSVLHRLHGHTGKPGPGTPKKNRKIENRDPRKTLQL